MKFERPRFELTRVYEDGTSEAPEIFPVDCMPPGTEMSRRGILGFGLGATALLFLLDGKIEGGQSSVAHAELSGLGQADKVIKAPDKPPLAHTNEVRALALSPDGKVLISGSEDNTVKFWSMPEGRWLNTLYVHPNDVSKLALTPDGKTLVTVSADTLRLWTIPEGQLRKVLDGHMDAVYTVAITSDGKLLISGSKDNTIKLWSLPEGELLTTLQGAGPIQSLALAPDGKTLAAGGKESGLRVWSLPEGRLRMKLSRYAVREFFINPAGHLITVSSAEVELRSLADGHLLNKIKSEGGIDEVAVSSDGKLVVSLASQSLSIWSLPEGKLLRKVEKSGYNTSLVLSPDSRMLLSRGGYESARLLSLPEGELLAELKTENRITAALFSTTGQQLVTGETGGGIALWGLHPVGFLRYISDPVLDGSKRPDKKLKAHASRVSALAVTNDGKLLASASHDDTAKVWSLPAGQLLATLEGHKDDINDLVITSDGKTLITASDDKTIKLWGLPDGIQSAPPPAQKAKQAARTPTHKSTPKARLIATLEGHAGIVRKLFLAVDDKTLISTDSEKAIKIWSLPDGRLLSTLPDPMKKLRALAITAEAKLLVTTTDARDDDTLQLWMLPEARLHTTLAGHGDRINAVTLTSDSKLLAAAAENNSVRLWDLSNGHLLGLLEGPNCSSLAFSPDGKLIAGCSSDNSISLWSMRDGRLLTTFEERRPGGYGRNEQTVIFAPNGQWLLSVPTNGGIRLWSVPEGRLLATFETDVSNDEAWVITPDSKILACGDHSGTVELWDLEKPGFRSFLFDRAANTSEIKGSSYNVYDKVTGQVITYTMPCGSPIPPGAVCTCNCVPGTERSYRPSYPSGGGGGGGGGTYCTCNRVCTCIPVPSDRDVKETYESTDPVLILQRLSELPIQKWNYKWDDTSVRHIGPMAQDFAAAFGVGEDDKHIHPVDAQGVAFAAIQALYKIAKESEEQMQTLRTQLLLQQEENKAVNERVEFLERLVIKAQEQQGFTVVHRERSV